MYHTKRIDETFPLEEKNLEELVLRKLSSLYKDKQKIGIVYQIAWNAKYPAITELQAELYFQAIPSDALFEKGLVKRENAFEPLEIEKPLEGIVISKSLGVIFSDFKNVLLIRPEHINDLQNIIDYQEKQRETFACYISSGSSMTGFNGYYYQPTGPDKDREDIGFIEKEQIGNIKKESKERSNNGLPTTYDYWNGEKVSETFLVCNNSLEVTIRRKELTFRKVLNKPHEKREGISLGFVQIPALKKIIDIYLQEKPLQKIN